MKWEKIIKTKLYQCQAKVRDSTGFGVFTFYDLESNTPDGIIEELKEQGHDVEEVWDIEEQ